MKREGFSLLELMIATAILAIVAVLVFVAMQSSTEAVSVADAQTVVLSNVRDVMAAIVREVQVAAKADDNTVTPTVAGLQVIPDPVPESPVEVVFQIPEDDTGRTWSSPIRLRFIQDEEGANGIPGQRVIRLQDRNGDGTFDGPGESVIIGASNDLSDVQFIRNGDILQITIEAERRVAGREGQIVRASQNEEVYLLN